MVQFKSMLGVIALSLMTSVCYNFMVNGDAYAQPNRNPNAGPPVCLLGLHCLPADNAEPDNRALAYGFCQDYADIFGIPYSHVVVTRCPSLNSVQNNRPYGPGDFCPIDDSYCPEGTIAYECSAFYNPSSQSCP